MKPKIEYKDVPPRLMALAQKSRRPPYGLCDCKQAQGELSNNGDYRCPRCIAKDAVYDKAEYYSVSGSNIHRITGKKIDTHNLEPYQTHRDKVKSHVTAELKRFGAY
jgi:ferredoxin-thioredoxin reductase catalytic subunit